ncbi:MAG TPA: hypothetical protein VIN08_01330 [Ohtaekwangia sp.]|uniref:tetratricopeptide repeat protein n=1 Tax=Ohtaekwangia sp. TaxID=2066019 RepID=UPI002F93B4C3
MSKRAFILSVFILIACGDRDKTSNQTTRIEAYKPNSVALKLNNKASGLIGDAGHTYDSLKNQLYDSAIIYLDKAIEIDSLYVLAYINKAQALQRKGSFEKAIGVLSRVQRIKPDFPEILISQGFLLEKIGKIVSAEQQYNKALKAYEERLKSNPKDEKTKSDIAFLYVFLKDKNAALDEIRNYLLENPESAQLKTTERYINALDRKTFINEY